MPKVVDADQRRRAVADAVLAVVARDGVEAASLRTVAREAGLAIGSVRHYFADHAELLRFALAELNARASARIVGLFDARDPGASAGSLALRALCEVLPLDERRRGEASVWLSFVTAARTRPYLADLAAESSRGIRALAGQVLTALVPDLKGVARNREIERLGALVDGLTLAALVDPTQADPDDLVAVVRLHLEGLTGSSHR